MTDYISLTEQQTRFLIDGKMRDAGWEVDTETLRFSKGTRPEAKKFRAIAEWPTKSGPADYALFCGLILVGVVEAKRSSLDVSDVLGQSKRYSRGIQNLSADIVVGGPWRDYRAPFLFSTNGRDYFEPAKEKSGIWYQDIRLETNHPRALVEWPTPQALLDFFSFDESEVSRKLKSDPIENLKGILRPYQMEAITSVDKAVGAGKRRIMVAMATGTGKTRTCIGLTYRFLKSGRFKKILFLVDRRELGKQAADMFDTLKLADGRAFSEIYDLFRMQEKEPEDDAFIHFATVQSLVKRVLQPAEHSERPSINQYDLVIIDECHRGYMLDKELSEEEEEFRDEEDFQAKYRKVLDYFDAVQIGLTATPAKHTTEIFGQPVFWYKYREAVIDGFLVDYEPPFQIKTELSQTGIEWEKGANVDVWNPETHTVDTAQLPDDLKIDVTGFNTQVRTENFNRVVCHELAREINPLGDEKTLIFCSRDDHADLVVRLLKEAFQDTYGQCPDDAVKKITAKTDDDEGWIRRFKNEKYPNVAVTVDLLSTGIDVPKICNIVFLRRIRSRILFDQILGRATRLCEEIHKESFRIFDAVGIFNALQAVSDMKSISQTPATTMLALALGAKKNLSDDALQTMLSQILSKVNRKHKLIKDDLLEKFKSLVGKTPEQWIKELKKERKSASNNWIDDFVKLAELLDSLEADRRKQLISDHEDAVTSIERGFGKYGNHEDYLTAFHKYIESHKNEMTVVNMIAKRPQDLTRAELRNLRLALDKEGFDEKQLRVAWYQKTNEDIAATIVGFIRRETIGADLRPFKERVDVAVRNLKARHSFTRPQTQWLDRIAQQIKQEIVVDRDALNQGAFQTNGGFNQINRIFDLKIESVLKELHKEIWTLGEEA